MPSFWSAGLEAAAEQLLLDDDSLVHIDLHAFIDGAACSRARRWGRCVAMVAASFLAAGISSSAGDKHRSPGRCA